MLEELQDNKDSEEYPQSCRNKNKPKTDLQGCLYSPCPHTTTCPRFEFDTIPCSFDVRYRNFSLNKIKKSFRDNVQEGRFSYIVFNCQFHPRSPKYFHPCHHCHSKFIYSH